MDAIVSVTILAKKAPLVNGAFFSIFRAPYFLGVVGAGVVGCCCAPPAGALPNGDADGLVGFEAF